LGVSLSLFACGQAFEANGSSAGAAGMPMSSGGTADAGGGESGAGAENGGSPEQSGGSAATDSGGSAPALGGRGGVTGAGGSPGAAGSATGGLTGTGGTGGIAGTGGTVEVSPIPQLGLLLWLRADHGVVQKDGLVEQWLDQSGNQTDAIQTAANVRPTYLATDFNGRPTLEFDGKQDFLKFDDGFGDFSHGLTGFIVAKPTDSACASLLELSNGSEIDDIALGVYQNQWTYEVLDGFIQAGKVDATKFSLYGIVHRTTGTLDLRADGDLLGTMSFALPAVPTNKVRQNNFIGHTLYGDCNYFQGQISEIILYTRSVTDKEILTIEGYLQDHWALAPASTL
jgi:hypothetical protein